jgi:hypothetical protein
MKRKMLTIKNGWLDRRRDTRHNDTRHNDTQPNNTQHDKYSV